MNANSGMPKKYRPAPSAKPKAILEREIKEVVGQSPSRHGRPVVKRGVRGIYEVLWYDTGAGEVRSLVNRTVVAKYTPGLGWKDHGRLPDDVREYAQQIASVRGSSI